MVDDLVRAVVAGFPPTALGAGTRGAVPALHPAWHDELVRRVKSLKDGSAELHDWEDVKRELDEIVGD